MSKQLSTITVLRTAGKPHQFILVRADFPNMDKEYIWCGAKGWRLLKQGEFDAEAFPSEAVARREADKIVSLPLNE